MEVFLTSCLVVSLCLGGALIGCVLSVWIANGVGRCRTFQLCALPMIIGASMSAATNNLFGILVGRLFVGAGLGLNPPIASLYVTKVSPSFLRGIYETFIEIASFLGLMGALFVGIPLKETFECYGVSVRRVHIGLYKVDV
ncbi:hypothetical protein VNO80_05711 [Phaseolus coccineus]|uniref:Major facilitator superfamily (MFS) profile domain-containing protein n=1 Tax=Phaseolus coccineus TaxID=3886 RepID=A0AAN9RI42_PHACN